MQINLFSKVKEFDTLFRNLPIFKLGKIYIFYDQWLIFHLIKINVNGKRIYKLRAQKSSFSCNWIFSKTEKIMFSEIRI